MHEHKLGELLLVKRNTVDGQSQRGGERTVRDQIRDLYNNRCRRNGKVQQVVWGSKEIEINEYHKPDRNNCKPTS